MTIEYKDSKRITALSTDFTTPIVWQNMTDGHSASGNVLSKSGANWTADATGTTTFSSSDGAKVEFTVSANTSDSFCGFDISTNTDSYDMDYALYCGGGGTINIYANGSQVTSTSVTYSTADTLAVNMDSSGTVTFLKNGSVFYTSSTTASGTYRVNAVIYTSGVSLTANYITSRPTDVKDNSLLVEKDTAKRYWFTPQTVDTEEAFSFTTTDTVNALWGNRIYGMKLLSGHSGLNKYIKKAKTYFPTNPTGSRLTTGTLYHVILDSSGTEIARSAGVSASSVSNNSWAETTLSTPVKLLENYTVGVTISTGSGSSYLGTAVNNNGSSPTNTTRYYKDESGSVSTSTSETILMVFDSDPATGLSIPSTWNMQPTYQTDFSSSTGWTTVGSNITITGGAITASAMATQTDNRIYYDLGSALSDKFVIDFDHYADSSPANSYWQMFALTDTTAIPRTDDGIYPLIDMGSWDTYLRYSNEGSETNVGTLGSLTTGQWQYVRFVRDGTTGTLTVYSDSARTTQVLNVSGTIPATVTGLRYFQSGALASANTGTATYKIDNLKIYDGVTSIN